MAKKNDGVPRNSLASGRLLVSEAETAKELGIDQSTLSRLARQGKAPLTPVHIGERRMYRRVDLLRLAGEFEGSGRGARS